MSFIKKLFGSNDTYVRRYQQKVDQINALEDGLVKLSNKELAAKTEEFRGRLVKGETLDDILPETFACVREASKRTIGQKHFDVQLIGGMVLHEGKIAEMRTGEGKTLVATLPLYLNALSGKGVHLITVNDFLAKFQAQWMGAIYNLLGLSVGAIGQLQESFIYSKKVQPTDDYTWQHLQKVSRPEAYQADITYGTNNEFGFDYLRDNMVYSLDQKSQRELNFAIVDEVDSILIDEARTPLIISAPAAEAADLYQKFARLTPQLGEGDYTVDEKDRHVGITDEGIKKMERWLNVENLYNPDNIGLVHHLDEALKAHFLFRRDKDYVVKDDEIIIVDEFTGRLMHGRRYSEGLHQAIEAKEKVTVKKESETMATISFQNLFRIYEKLAGMTGTAATEAEEFFKIYKLEVVEVPTHRQMVRVDRSDRIYKNEEAKLEAVAKEIGEKHEAGQPVLVGTPSIEKNEVLSKLLTKAGVPHNVLNAKQHEREARTIAQAGRLGAVTVATNIAGRGIDIILGGTAPAEVESRKLKVESKAEEQGENSGEDIDTGLSVLIKDHRNIKDWQAEHEKVVELGGLHVVGTERHESRRIDNQLRGRAGRQGDPGSSIFFVSMDDDLMRIFGGDRMKGLMDKLGLPDDVPIENKLISGSIEQAQKKVESHNFDIRKHLLDYDDVMNKHRQAIYRKRNLVIVNKAKNTDGIEVSLHEDVLELMSDEERVEFDKKIKQYGMEVISQAERLVYLRVIDRNWVEHLTSMEELRHGIGLRGYGQKDPLVEYKKASYEMYQKLVERIEDETIELLLKLEVQQRDHEQTSNKQTRTIAQEHHEESTPATQTLPTQTGPVSVTVRKKGEATAQTSQGFNNQFIQKVGRNDPCPCGSGKKYKKCHGK